MASSSSFCSAKRSPSWAPFHWRAAVFVSSLAFCWWSVFITTLQPSETWLQNQESPFIRSSSSMVPGVQTPVYDFAWPLDDNPPVLKVILGHSLAWTHLLVPTVSLHSFLTFHLCLIVCFRLASNIVRVCFSPSGHHADGWDIQPQQMGNNARYVQSDSPVSLACVSTERWSWCIVGRPGSWPSVQNRSYKLSWCRFYNTS